jgi:ssDNA-binding Zn-finger/Zn-ribbon topoisomerase 1
MAAKFTPISKQEMESFLGLPHPGEDNKAYPADYKGFKPVRLEGTVELVYSLRVDPEPGKQLALRIFTGINPDGLSRAVGEDAIRVSLWSRDDEGVVMMVGGSRRCHRVAGWRTNLQKRIDSWKEQCGPSCPKCGRMMAERESKRGKFWGCPAYRKDDPMTCNGTRDVEGRDTSYYPKVATPVQAGKVQAPRVQGDPGVDCPLCRNPMRVRHGKQGEFLGCIQYPECKGTREMDGSLGRTQVGKVQAPTNEPALPPCPKCGAEMRRRNGPKGEFMGCSQYSSGCRGTRDVDGTDTSAGRVQAGRVQAPRTEPVLPPCPRCNAAMKVRQGAKGEFLGCTKYPECRGTREVEGPVQTPRPAPLPAPTPEKPQPVRRPVPAPAPQPTPQPARQAGTAVAEAKGPKCPRSGCNGFLILTKGHRSDYWCCSNAPRCNWMAAAE